MPETQHWSYDLIKSAISQKDIGPADLANFKNLFKDEIQSSRRFACIRSFDDLLDCLERRDCLSEQNIEPIHLMAEYFADDELDISLEKYKPPPKSNEPQNLYALQRIQEQSAIKAEITNQTLCNEKASNNHTIIEFTQKKRDQIYKLIADEIGRNWRFFGRELSVRVGDLDKIDVKHPNDLQSKVFEVLELFENNPAHNPREHYNLICEALDSCRRKDIRKNVQKIMSY